MASKMLEIEQSSSSDFLRRRNRRQARVLIIIRLSGLLIFPSSYMRALIPHARTYQRRKDGH